jgi:hypothetical protein
LLGPTAPDTAKAASGTSANLRIRLPQGVEALR